MVPTAESELIAALDDWIQLLEHPACQVRNSVADLRERRNRIASDPARVSDELVDGGIWGQMGSLIDSALMRYRHPTSTLPEERRAQWQAAADEAQSWQRKFYAATIVLGERLIACCSAHGGIEPEWQRMIEEWIRLAQYFNSLPEEPLSAKNIEVLESNLRGGFL